MNEWFDKLGVRHRGPFTRKGILYIVNGYVWRYLDHQERWVLGSIPEHTLRGVELADLPPNQQAAYVELLLRYQ